MPCLKSKHRSLIAELRTFDPGSALDLSFSHGFCGIVWINCQTPGVQSTYESYASLGSMLGPLIFGNSHVGLLLGTVIAVLGRYPMFGYLGP